MFDRELLAALRAVIDLKTVTAAADHLRLTPSAVSQQLSKLQRQAGIDLLVKHGRYLHPTEAARILAQAAVEMDLVDASTQAQLEELQRTPGGHVTIDAPPIECRALIGPVATQLAQEHSKVTLFVRETYSEQGLEQVLKGDSDIALIHDWEHRPLTVPDALARYLLGTDDVDLIVPRDHPAAQRESISIGELPGERWITDTRQAHAHWLQHSLDTARIPYQMVARVNEHESQISLTARGIGLSVVSRLGRSPLPDAVRAVQLSSQFPSVRFMMAVRKDSINRPALRAVHHLLDVHAKSILRQAPPAQR